MAESEEYLAALSAQQPPVAQIPEIAPTPQVAPTNFRDLVAAAGSEVTPETDLLGFVRKVQAMAPAKPAPTPAPTSQVRDGAELEMLKAISADVARNGTELAATKKANEEIAKTVASERATTDVTTAYNEELKRLLLDQKYEVEAEKQAAFAAGKQMQAEEIVLSKAKQAETQTLAQMKATEDLAKEREAKVSARYKELEELTAQPLANSEKAFAEATSGEWVMLITRSLLAVWKRDPDAVLNSFEAFAKNKAAELNKQRELKAQSIKLGLEKDEAIFDIRQDKIKREAATTAQIFDLGMKQAEALQRSANGNLAKAQAQSVLQGMAERKLRVLQSAAEASVAGDGLDHPFGGKSPRDSLGIFGQSGVDGAIARIRGLPKSVPTETKKKAIEAIGHVAQYQADVERANAIFDRIKQINYSAAGRIGLPVGPNVNLGGVVEFAKKIGGDVPAYEEITSLLLQLRNLYGGGDFAKMSATEQAFITSAMPSLETNDATIEKQRRTFLGGLLRKSVPNYGLLQNHGIVIPEGDAVARSAMRSTTNNRNLLKATSGVE